MAQVAQKRADEGLKPVQTGSVSVEIAIKPAELMDIEGSKVHQVAANNGCVLALYESKDGPRLALFNAANRRIPLSSLVINGMVAGQPASFDAANMNGAAKDLKSNLEIFTDHSERYIVVRYGEIYNFFRTVDEDSRTLPVERWTSFSLNRSEFTPEKLNQYPVLYEFLSSDKGRAIDGLDRAVSCENGVLTIVNTRQGTRLVNVEATCFALDPNRKGVVAFIDKNNSLRTVDVSSASQKSIAITTSNLPIEGRAIGIRLDPHSNFYVVTAEQDGKRNLMLIERDTLKTAGTIRGVSGSYDFNRFGDIFYVDSEGRLRLASTNLHTFAPDGLVEARELERARLSRMVESSRAITLPELPEEQPEEKPSLRVITPPTVRDEMVKQARVAITAQLGPMVEKANSAQALNKLSIQIEALKVSDAHRSYPEVFSEVDQMLNAKLDGIETIRLKGLLKEHRQLVESSSLSQNLADLTEKWADIERLRRGLEIPDQKVREGIDRELAEIRDLNRAIVQKLEAGLVQRLERQFQKIREMVEDTLYVKDLHSLGITQPFLDFEQSVSSIVDDDKRGEWRSKYKELIREKGLALSSRQQSETEAKNTKIIEALEDAKEILGRIKEAVGNIQHTIELSNSQELKALKLAFKAKVYSLPEDLGSKWTADMDAVLEQRRQELIQIQGANLMRRGDIAPIGKESFPVAPEIHLIWSPMVKPSRKSTELGILVFRDTAGREFEPEIGLVPYDMNSAATKQAIELTRVDAEKYFANLPAKIPGFNKKWVFNDWSVGVLEQIAVACREQLELEKSGVVILSGEAGCGKDVLWKMFCYLTQRGLEPIGCGENTEKEHLTNDFKFDPERGRLMIPSRLLVAVQMPYTVCLFTEINTSRTGVMKFLNSAFDESREIPIDYQPAVKIDESVILGGTMNGQHYEGTNKISQEVLDRATVIKVGYPPFYDADNNRYFPWEAEILAKHIPALAKVPQKEFYAMWNFVVNKDKTIDGNNLMSDDQKKLITSVFTLLQIANRVRDEYDGYHSGDGKPMADYVFSMRGTRKIAVKLKPDSKVEELVRRMVMPKVELRDERDRIEAFINDPEVDLSKVA